MSKQSKTRALLTAGPLLAAVALGSPLQAQDAAPNAAANTARPAPNVFATDVENIALAANGGRVVSVTSTLDNDPALSAGNLIDGQVRTAAKPKASAGWASNRFDPIDMEMVTLGFKGDALRRIGKVVINPTAAVAPERWAKDVEIQVSVDGSEGSFRPVAFATLRRAGQAQEFKFVPADARFVRLVFRTNWGSDRAVALGEVEVYEAIGQGDAIGQIINQFEGAVGELKRFQQVQFNTGAVGAVAASGQLSEATVQLIQAMGGAAGRLGGTQGQPNIAASANGGYIANFSSQFVSDPAKGADPEYAPQLLLDGQVLKNDAQGNSTGTNGWASQGFSPGKQFVTVGFKDDRVKLISKIVLNPTSGQSDLRWARRIEVQVTTEDAKAGPFRTVSTINLRPQPINQEFSLGPVEAKYVRLVFQANGPGDVRLGGNVDPDINSDRSVSLGEVELYEAVAGGQQLEALVKRFDQVLLELKNLRKAGAAPQANALTAASQPLTKTQQS